MKRIVSVDIVRGLVLMIMAIDHCRDLIGNAFISDAPLNLKTTTPGLFMTRWITHLCAPTFVFLSGVSAFLAMKNKPGVAAAKGFLFRRGLWLIVINFTVNNFAIFFDIHFGIFFSQVIAAIGFGFIGLALLLKLPAKTIGMIGLIIIFGHDALGGVSFPKGSTVEMLWALFMTRGFFPLNAGHVLAASYPFIPWMGVLLAGFAFGKLFDFPAEKRKKVFMGIGLGALLIFVLLRWGNFYGEPNPWSHQKSGLFTFLSFINNTKYPPSLLFILMTLGISIILLALVENARSAVTNIVIVYGKVPFFYWMVHWFVIHFLAIAVFLSQGYHWSDLDFGAFDMGHPKQGGGLALPGLYLAWAGVVIFMYPISRMYGNYKAAHRDNKWLSYL
jgi:uncharacterized membrane protein